MKKKYFICHFTLCLVAAGPLNAGMFSFFNEACEDIIIRFEENQMLVNEGVSRIKKYFAQKLSTSTRATIEKMQSPSVEVKKTRFLTASVLCALFSVGFLINKN